MDARETGGTTAVSLGRGALTEGRRLAVLEQLHALRHGVHLLEVDRAVVERSLVRVTHRQLCSRLHMAGRHTLDEVLNGGSDGRLHATYKMAVVPIVSLRAQHTGQVGKVVVETGR